MASSKEKEEAMVALLEIIGTPVPKSKPIVKINYDGITFSEWSAAAGLADKRYDSMFHESCVVSAAREAWERGDDPTDYRSNHSAFELLYNSEYGFRIRGMEYVETTNSQ